LDPPAGIQQPGSKKQRHIICEDFDLDHSKHTTPTALTVSDTAQGGSRNSTLSKFH
jgi:hypothetical protein